MHSAGLKSIVGASILAACAATALPANAITVNDTYGLPASAALGAPFTSVVNILLNGNQQCTGSLIAADMILTAQHCIRSTTTNNLLGVAADFTVEVKSAAGVTLHSIVVDTLHELPGDTTSVLLDGTDIAVLELTGDVPGASATSLRLLDAPSAAMVGRLATSVGFGRFGTGTTGAANASDGTRRAMTNIVDFYGESKGNACTSNGGANILNTDFDNDGAAASNTLSPAPCNSQATTLAQNASEGSTATGDSGGPLLLFYKNEWLIAGVLSGGRTPVGPVSGFSDISWWTGTDMWQTFIEGFGGEFRLLPAPQMFGLFVLGLVGVALLRRRGIGL
jgi:hypothetical protein